ncbi:ATP synthase F1 subunit delta [Candidatus Uhrbacteria bacterium]|nr:ATP synthase F1 subunit delta [Candidatus Uhrbacteria bacterium]
MKITPKQYAYALYELCKKVPSSRIDEITKEYVTYFAKRGRVKILPTIAQELKRHLSSVDGNIPVHISSAHVLDEQTIAHITTAVKKKHKKEPVLSFHEDTRLIGGVKIKIGHTVIDASVRSYIQQFKEHISLG